VVLASQDSSPGTIIAPDQVSGEPWAGQAPVSDGEVIFLRLTVCDREAMDGDLDMFAGAGNVGFFAEYQPDKSQVFRWPNGGGG
jgi:hypothetical protein